MTMFWFLAVAMLALALLIVLPALLRPRADEQLQIGGGASQSNLVILREQLAQLEAQHSAGAMDPQQYALARGDIERRVLDEESAVERPTRAGRARTTAVLLAVGVPVLALALYLRVGSPDAVLAPELASVEEGTVTQAQIEAMVEQLAQRLAKPPAGEQPDPRPGRCWPGPTPRCSVLRMPTGLTSEPLSSRQKTPSYWPTALMCWRCCRASVLMASPPG